MSFKPSEGDHIYFPKVISQLDSQLNNLKEFRGDVLFTVVLLSQLYVHQFSMSVSEQDNQIRDGLYVMTKLLETKNRQIGQLFLSQVSLDLQKMSERLFRDMLAIRVRADSIDEEMLLIYLKSLKALGKDKKDMLKYTKRHFTQDLGGSLLLHYKFIKWEYTLSGQLEDDYLFVYYPDISAFIDRFRDTKRAVRLVVKKKDAFYDRHSNKFNKMYNFFKAIDL